MEHRCGLRRTTRLRVTIRALHGASVDAQIVCLSGSGALVLCPLQAPVGSVLLVRFDPRQADSRLALTARAEVIRPVQGGIAVEWEQFAPMPVRAALRYIAANAEPRELSAQPHRERAPGRARTLASTE